MQLLLVMLSGMLLDGGATFQLVALPAVGYWLVVLVILLRRAKTLTRLDTFLLKAGFIILLAVLPFTSQWWGWLR